MNYEIFKILLNDPIFINEFDLERKKQIYFLKNDFKTNLNFKIWEKRIKIAKLNLVGITMYWVYMISIRIPIIYLI